MPHSLRSRLLPVALVALAVLLASLTAWFLTRPTLARPGTLGDLTTDAAALLRALPDVALVEVRHQPEGTPTGRIVHVLDWHLVPDIADEKHVLTVELVQQEQMGLLKALIEQHDVTGVWVEALTPENRQAFLASLEPFRGHTGLPPTPPELLVAGSAARLYLAGVVKELLPPESARLHKAGQLRGGVVDADVSQQRDRAIVGNIVTRGEPLAVIVLGGGHDLSDHVRIDAPAWEYIRVETKGYREASGGR